MKKPIDAPTDNWLSNQLKIIQIEVMLDEKMNEMKAKILNELIGKKQK